MESKKFATCELCNQNCKYYETVSMILDIYVDFKDSLEFNTRNKKMDVVINSLLTLSSTILNCELDPKNKNLHSLSFCFLAKIVNNFEVNDKAKIKFMERVKKYMIEIIKQDKLPTSKKIASLPNLSHLNN